MNKVAKIETDRRTIDVIQHKHQVMLAVWAGMADGPCSVLTADQAKQLGEALAKAGELAAEGGAA